MKSLFFLLITFFAILFGYRMGEDPAVKKKSAPKLKISVDPNRDCPVIESKPFVFAIYSYQQAAWCQRALRSIFEQEYDNFRVIFFDDGSSDDTFEKVQAFALENNQEHRIILIRNEERLGPVACLYRAVDQSLDEEIVLPMDGKNWLLHEQVLRRLNAVYQNPDVWFTVMNPMQYPTYAMGPNLSSVGEEFSLHAFVSFYSGLFKQVRLADLMQDGRFVEGRESYFMPIVQMSGGRYRILNEPLFMENLACLSREVQSKPFTLYSALSAFPRSNPMGELVDIILFSCDRPMQLYACLESIQRYLVGYGQIAVICRANDSRQRACYQRVQESFPEVRFLFQSTKPRRDFKPILLKTLSESPSNFVLFGVDDQIVTDFTDLKQCTEMMERTGAYGFYLRLGTHITYCYQTGRDQSVPQSVMLGQGVLAWNIKVGHSDWEFPNTLDMTLYRKSYLQAPFEKMRYRHPNSLEFAWAKNVHPQQEIGLYFEHAKVLNIPLNIVSKTGNPHMNCLSIDDLLVKFEQGLKIDIDPLYRFDNASPHIEYEPQFKSADLSE